MVKDCPGAAIQVRGHIDYFPISYGENMGHKIWDIKYGTSKNKPLLILNTLMNHYQS